MRWWRFTLGHRAQGIVLRKQTQATNFLSKGVDHRCNPGDKPQLARFAQHLAATMQMMFKLSSSKRAIYPQRKERDNLRLLKLCKTSQHSNASDELTIALNLDEYKVIQLGNTPTSTNAMTLSPVLAVKQSPSLSMPKHKTKVTVLMRAPKQGRRLRSIKEKHNAMQVAILWHPKLQSSHVNAPSSRRTCVLSAKADSDFNLLTRTAKAATMSALL